MFIIINSSNKICVKIVTGFFMKVKKEAKIRSNEIELLNFK